MARKLFIGFFLLLVLISVFAEDVVIAEGDLSPTDKIIKQTQQNILQSSQISTKIDLLAQSNVDNLQAVAEFLDGRISEIQTSFIVILILVCLSTMGLWWAIFLYFQSRNLIIFPKKEKMPEIPAKAVEQSSKELLNWKTNRK